MDTKISTLLNDFNEIRKEYIETLSKFPQDKISEKLFGEWDLKDVIAHFVGWDVEFTNALKSLIKGEKYTYWGKIYEFNDKVVKSSKGKTWDQVFTEFEKSGNDFIDIYKRIPDEMMEVKIWKDKIYTPKRILEINIHHYEKAQLMQIKKYLTKRKIS